MIPTKNNQDTVFRCIDSVLSVDYPAEKLEILVLDSSSPPLTLPEGVKDRVTILFRDYSPPAAYNSLLPRAKGDIVAFIDSDAVADRTWLRRLIDGFTDQQAGAVGGHIRTWNRENPLARSIGYELEGRYLRMPDRILRISTSNLAVRKDVLVRIGGFDERLRTGYDAKLGLEINKLGYAIKFNPEAVVYHYHRPSFAKFFQQQRTYAVNDVMLYLSGFPMRQDNVTTPWMLVELSGWILAAVLGLAAVLTAIAWNGLGTVPAVSAFLALLVVLLASMMFRGLAAAVARRDPVALVFYPVMLATRAAAWIIGGLEGMIKLVRRTDKA